MYNSFARQQAAPRKAQQSLQVAEFPAAVGGLSSAKSLGRNAKPYAQVLENGYVTQTGVRPRAGNLRHATTGTRAVRAFLTYESGLIKSLFACADGKIFNVTSPASPTVPPASVVSGLTGNDWVGVTMATTGGEFLVAVNGTDPHRVYDGASWAAATAITGVSSAQLSHVWIFASRLFFVRKDTLEAWYLPVDSFGGAATMLDLRGVFQKGSSLLYGATWSSDSGNGLSQKCVFVTKNGEAAVYEGNDPSNAATWRKLGVYDISKPLGKGSYTNIGGELVVITDNGLVPISEAVNKDIAALSLSSISKEIGPQWRRDAELYGSRSWSFVKWPSKGLGYIFFNGTYTSGGSSDVLDAYPFNYVVNLADGAWSIYRGWDMQCAVLFDGNVYFGSANGRVYAAERNGSDDGASYVFRYADWPSLDGQVKSFLQARTTFTHTVPFNPQIGISTDYKINWPVAPSAALDGDEVVVWDLPGAVWDGGARWDQSGVSKTAVRWRSLGRTGYRAAIMVQMTFSNLLAPDCEIISTDVTYREGALVV